MKKLLAIGASILAFAFLFTSSAYAYTHTVTLKMGSRGAQVTALQMALNTTNCKVGSGLATGYFGTLTASAVRCFQSANGLGVDAVVGPRTGAALAALGMATPGLPAGCTSTSGFSSTTGAPCNGSSSSVPGCLPGYLYSSTTGQRCDSGTNNGNNSGALQGGAGDVNITTTSTDVEDTVAEGDDNVKVLGFKVEANGSDVRINSVKVTFKNCEVNCTSAATNSSENLENYVDSVSIYMDNSKVGSADVKDFNRDTGSPDEFSTTINLSNAIVREDKDAKFYVVVSANSSIDTEDINNADWNVAVDTVRFTDATGAILTADVGDIDDQTFSFEDASANDDISIATSTANPENASVQVDADTTSDETLALAFKLKVDSDSSDVMINSIPITLTVSNGGTGTGNIEDIIDTVTVKVGSKSWDADLDGSGTLTNGAGTATYTADFNDDEFTINSGDDEEVKVYIKFNDQDGNYSEGTVVTASVDPDNIDAETDNDEIDVGGSTKTGADLTLLVSGASLTLDGNPSRTTSGDNDENATFTFKVNAATFDNDVYIPKAGSAAVDYDIVNASTGVVYSGGTQSVSVSGLADSDTVNSTPVWVVGDSDNNFTITVVLNNSGGTAGQYYARINSINLYTDDTATSTTNIDVDEGDFQTDPIQVGS